MRRGRLALLSSLALSLPLLVVGLGVERLAREDGMRMSPEAIAASAHTASMARTTTRGQDLVLASAAALFVIGLGLGWAGLVRPRGERGEAPPERDVEREVREVAARLSRGDFDVRLESGASETRDAIGRMAVELERARARAAKAERVAAWRDIAQRIAHEIKNPLTPIRMAIETMQKTFARGHPDFPEIFDESTRTVLEEVARMERIVTEFSRFARLPRPRAVLTSPRELVAHVVAMHDVGAAALTSPDSRSSPRVRLEVEDGYAREGDEPRARLDREQITQVLVNLIQNAIDATSAIHEAKDGQVLVRLRRDANGSIGIEVHDDGPGVPEGERGRIFEPYVTHKAHGTGLGLPICDRIVSDHGGSLTVDASPILSGARFVVTLDPRGPAEEADGSRSV